MWWIATLVSAYLGVWAWLILVSWLRDKGWWFDDRNTKA
jgi:hypothetical protein